jgi:hypothetical protein
MHETQYNAYKRNKLTSRRDRSTGRSESNARGEPPLPTPPLNLFAPLGVPVPDKSALALPPALGALRWKLLEYLLVLPALPLTPGGVFPADSELLGGKPYPNPNVRGNELEVAKGGGMSDVGKWMPVAEFGGDVEVLGHATPVFPPVLRSGMACGRDEGGREIPLGVPIPPPRSDELGELSPDAEDANVEDLNADMGVGGGRARTVPSDDPVPTLLLVVVLARTPPAPICKCSRVKFETAEGGEVDVEVLFLPPIPLVRPKDPGTANARLSVRN